MHPGLVLLPVGFCLKCLQRLLFGAVSTEHIGFTRLALPFLVWKRGGRGGVDVIYGSDTVLELIVMRTANVRRRRQHKRNRPGWI
jgi:hypothetical protein